MQLKHFHTHDASRRVLVWFWFWFWFGFGFGFGLVLVWFWFGFGLVLVLVLVWFWFGFGLVLVWFCFGFVLVLVGTPAPAPKVLGSDSKTHLKSRFFGAILKKHQKCYGFRIRDCVVRDLSRIVVPVVLKQLCPCESDIVRFIRLAREVNAGHDAYLCAHVPVDAGFDAEGVALHNFKRPLEHGGS